MLYLDFLKERYEETDFAPLTLEKVAEVYEDLQASKGISIFKTPRGFISYEFKGDAAILYDVYVSSEVRGRTESLIMMKALFAIARKAGKRMVISFSEHVGKNKNKGLSLAKFLGFEKAYDLKGMIMLIIGI